MGSRLFQWFERKFNPQAQLSHRLYDDLSRNTSIVR